MRMHEAAVSGHNLTLSKTHFSKILAKVYCFIVTKGQLMEMLWCYFIQFEYSLHKSKLFSYIVSVDNRLKFELPLILHAV